jgi:hypothetical protein
MAAGTCCLLIKTIVLIISSIYVSFSRFAFTAMAGLFDRLSDLELAPVFLAVLFCARTIVNERFATPAAGRCGVRKSKLSKFVSSVLAGVSTADGR